MEENSKAGVGVAKESFESQNSAGSQRFRLWSLPVGGSFSCATASASAMRSMLICNILYYGEAEGRLCQFRAGV